MKAGDRVMVMADTVRAGADGKYINVLGELGIVRRNPEVSLMEVELVDILPGETVRFFKDQVFKLPAEKS